MQGRGVLNSDRVQARFQQSKQTKFCEEHPNYAPQLFADLAALASQPNALPQIHGCLKSASLLLGNHLQEIWKTERIRSDILLRLSKTRFPDEDLQSFVSMVFEKIATIVLSVVGIKVSNAVIQRMQTLHINELSQLTSMGIARDLLLQWAGNKWPAAPQLSKKHEVFKPTQWSDVFPIIGAIYKQALQKAPKSQLDETTYVYLRSFMLAFMLLCVIDEHFLTSNAVTLVDSLKEETKAEEVEAILTRMIDDKIKLEYTRSEQLVTAATACAAALAVEWERFDCAPFWRRHGQQLRSLLTQTRDADANRQFVEGVHERIRQILSPEELDRQEVKQILTLFEIDDSQAPASMTKRSNAICYFLQNSSVPHQDRHLVRLSVRVGFAFDAIYGEMQDASAIPVVYKLMTAYCKAFEPFLAADSKPNDLPTLYCDNPNCAHSHATDTSPQLNCSACKLKFYCSRECQKQDWPEAHKPQCSAWKGLLNT